jgi:hypothetical protein
LKLYTHLGFIPFGPRVGGNGATFQPMYLTLETFRVTGRALARRKPSGVVTFLPGPVEMRSEVREAMGATPVSHRSDEFLRDVADVRTALCAMTGARHVQLLLGSGTLANDAVSAQLRQLNLRGLVLSNGEFGVRLIDHASRWGLDFARLSARGDRGPDRAVARGVAQGHRDQRGDCVDRDRHVGDRVLASGGGGAGAQEGFVDVSLTIRARD